MPKSIALPMPYRKLTGHPKDGGVLTTTNHLLESRCMWGVSPFCLTEPIGVAHAPASLLNAPTTTEGGAYALAPLLGHPRHA